MVWQKVPEIGAKKENDPKKRGVKGLCPTGL
jgi:hypothetical protein